MIRKIAIVRLPAFVVAAFSIMPGCREDDQVLTFRVQANEWADPSIPASEPPSSWKNNGSAMGGQFVLH